MSGPLMFTYNRLPVAFSHGEGAVLSAADGERYLDALSGVAVCGLGHGHPKLRQAIADQAGKLLHTSNLYGIALQEKLGGRLCALSGMDAVFFANSGAEANETAIKLARMFGRKRGVAKPTIIVMENSFHGRTMATLSATGNRRAQAGFEPLVAGFARAPFNDVAAVRRLAAGDGGSGDGNIVAVLVEPIQGEGGVVIPAADYLNELRAVCDENDWLLMLDEIQTGVGRTGKWFAHQHHGVRPDVMTLAKGLGNGVPIGACVARGAAAQTFTPGSHGSTFGGNPLSCRAALTVLEVIEAGGLLRNAADMGRLMLNGFKQRLGGRQGVVDIRGLGLMIAIELERDCAELVGRALEEKLLINVTGGNRIRLLPPLIINRKQADTIVDIVSRITLSFLSAAADD